MTRAYTLTVTYRTPAVEAALIVTYLQFPIQVYFPCIGQPVTSIASVTDNFVVLIIVTIVNQATNVQD